MQIGVTSSDEFQDQVDFVSDPSSVTDPLNFARWSYLLKLLECEASEKFIQKTR